MICGSVRLNARMRSRSDLGLELLGLAAEHQHIATPGTRRAAAPPPQSLQGAQLDEIDVRRTDQLVAEDFADRAGGRNDRLHAGRQFDVLKPFNACWRTK